MKGMKSIMMILLSFLALLTAFSGGNTAYEIPAAKADGVIALYPITNPYSAYEYFVTENTSAGWLDHLGDKIYCSLYSGKTGSLAGETKEIMIPVFGDCQSDENYYADADISTLIGTQNIPILLIQGELDSMVVVADNRKFFEELKQKGKTTAYLELPGLDHAFDLVDGTAQKRPIKEEITNWLRCFAD